MTADTPEFQAFLYGIMKITSWKRRLRRTCLAIAFVSALVTLTANLKEPAFAASGQSAPGGKPAPTLGFKHLKDVSPVFDSDAYEEESEMQKKLPGNEFVKDKRLMHEAALMNEFLEGFKDSKECNGITFYMTQGKTPAFAVSIGVSGHDKHPDDQTWTWLLFWPGDPSPSASKGHGMGGMGSQSSGKLTARDVCLTVWDDIDPNHFKKPGGKIE